MTAMLIYTEHAGREKHKGHSGKVYLSNTAASVCLPYLMPEELEAKEKKFLLDNPDW